MIRVLVVIAALFFSFASLAEDVYRDKRNGNYLVLKPQTPCALPASLLDHARIRPQYRGKLRGAILYYNGRALAACYATKGGLVRAIDEEGQFVRPLPYVDFNNE